MVVFRMNTLVDMLENLDIHDPSHRTRRWIHHSAWTHRRASYTTDTKVLKRRVCISHALRLSSFRFAVNQKLGLTRADAKILPEINCPLMVVKHPDISRYLSNAPTIQKPIQNALYIYFELQNCIQSLYIQEILVLSAHGALRLISGMFSDHERLLELAACEGYQYFTMAGVTLIFLEAYLGISALRAVTEFYETHVITNYTNETRQAAAGISRNQRRHPPRVAHTWFSTPPFANTVVYRLAHTLA
ncbi:uncharacterized protein BDR25DRAFT_363245 [Lindgomyces ingoldianus]|uniref:Uncharacterized protein n=1 Tax=Lindgomyces ingoldianus TaxID=673940 RepID=A0ACB6Q812_9PLEO|nr:uncharacterized protein BDR25DRAFT_363245 [Lindgomyces ingoldianus]KAF2463038.1 hypothetical protein BDR25DRAFT_363245 [Lindgomyces ingoldianus]